MLITLRKLIRGIGSLQDYFPEKNTAQLLKEQYEAEQTAKELQEIDSQSKERLYEATSEEELDKLEKSYQRTHYAMEEAIWRAHLIDDTLYLRSTLN